MKKVEYIDVGKLTLDEAHIVLSRYNKNISYNSIFNKTERMIYGGCIILSITFAILTLMVGK